ncbi:GNAT family N-acetyltransferase [Flammeovirga kamogawensis]|uniref:GNAT family N-acetyltransferase n=1 Tax=Flammeovirga kamogawensis TaxID=373891 RepID=A0ABX8H3F9_9BACT|nr:GNAT family N-acetyltransferase [Flammeovirga kamogawensis]MBB6463130.1 putative GNAT family N-acyltransferase [Flammeovirga kamogawensis]QWG10365.1 GNAT family N-acetyltransferase [Flammeovirga kamogawensis]TRX63875.1 GNAT family N-acetyltransferase [Flammeovirga kamogawensis]
MRFIYITTKDKFYQAAVDLRIATFFKEFDKPEILINDVYENDSFHIVCLDKHDVVIGTGRLNIEEDKGIISQMAVSKEYQNHGIGRKIIEMMIEKCQKSNTQTIVLNAREDAIEFYQKFGFHKFGEPFASKKTGVLHRVMKKVVY